MTALVVSRAGLLKSVLASTALLVVGSVIIWVNYRTPPATTIGVIGSLLLLVWLTKIRLFVRGIAVAFSSEGLTDYTTGLGFVAWSEIVSASWTTYWFGEYVELELRDPQVVIARLPWLRALMLKANLKRGLPGAAINASWVSGGAEAIFASLRPRVPTNEG